MRARRICRFASLFTAVAAGAWGQQFPFQLLVTQANSAITIQNGGTLIFNSRVGQPATAQVTATFSGLGQITVSQAPVVFGSTAFTAALVGTVPITLNPGETLSFKIQFLPTSGSQSVAQFSLPFLQTIPGTGGAPASATSNTITLVLQGTAPSFVESYVLQTDLNVIALQPGGTIVFPSTLVNATAQAALNTTNIGSGPGTITGISITGAAFRLTGTPLFPFPVGPGVTLQILVLYQPTAVASNTGQIQITFDAGAPVTINLQGNGTASSFVYQIETNPPAIVPPGGTVSFPDTNLGQTSSVVVRVLNTGTANGTVSLINVSGQAFQLSNQPVLPQTLAPNASITFTLTFAPTQPGTLTGSLFINSDTLKLSGVGLGPQLAFSYVAGGATITIGPANPSVIFSPVMISQSAQVSFEVKNTGTLPAVISNIGVGQPNGPYSLSGLPPLPVSLAPGADFQFTITFTPTALGFSNGTLQIDSTSIGLVGSGTQPPPLPAYTIAGASGTVAAQSQLSISLTLASAYPVAIAGTLTVSSSGNLPADPAVQFATGGLTVQFVIPANSTTAMFGNQGAQIGVQSGTVATSITLTPTFATQAGNVLLTPSPPATLQFAVAPAAPTLIAIGLSNQTTTGFLISVTGFTTTRTLTTWNVRFTTTAGFNMPTSQFAIDVQPVATVWFSSSASQAFGGQFTVTIPFTFQGTLPIGQSILSAIASVSVTMSNAVGTSNSIQATLR